MSDTPQKPKWTQDEAVAFECAREAISDRIAILTGQIGEERAKPVPDSARIKVLEEAMSGFIREQRGVHVHETAKIARIRAEYGAFVHAWREKGRVAAA